MPNLTHTICDLQHRVIEFSTRRWRQIQPDMEIRNELEHSRPGTARISDVYIIITKVRLASKFKL